MKRNLFSSKAIAAVAVVGALAAVPAAASAATNSSSNSNSTTIFATLQGTSLLGQELPILGTQGFDITLPVNSNILPQAVWNALDITVSGSVSLGDLQLLNLYLDPHMVR